MSRLFFVGVALLSFGAVTLFSGHVAAEGDESGYATYRSSQDFDTRWKLVEHSRIQPASEAIDAWLVSAAKTAPEWMLRAAAVDALVARRSERRLDVARDRLSDAYPRVRIAALHALRSERSFLHLIAKVARQDPWPRVRAAAIDCLDHDSRALPLIRAMLKDSSIKVRRASVEALTRLEDCAAWPLVKERLFDEGEWPEVIASALMYVERLCPVGAEEVLERLIERGQRAQVWAPDRELATASIQTLGVMGGPDSLRLLRKFRDTARSPIEKKYFENLIRTGAQDRCPARNTRDTLLPVRHLTRGIFP